MDLQDMKVLEGAVGEAPGEEALRDLQMRREEDELRYRIDDFYAALYEAPVAGKPARDLLARAASALAGSLDAALALNQIGVKKIRHAETIVPYINVLAIWFPVEDERRRMSGPQTVAWIVANVVLGKLLAPREGEDGLVKDVAEAAVAAAIAGALDAQVRARQRRGSDETGDHEIFPETDLALEWARLNGDPEAEAGWRSWDERVRYAFAEWLLSELVNTGTLCRVALGQVVETADGGMGRSYVVEMLPEVEQRLDEEHAELSAAGPGREPMVCPPRPWASAIQHNDIAIVPGEEDERGPVGPPAESRTGGRLRAELRRKAPTLKRGAAASEWHKTAEVLASINQLQAVEWLYNEQILAAAERDRPQGAATTKKEKSKRRLCRRQLEAARKRLADGMGRFYPHVIDWRTRFYTDVGVLTWQEGDLARGMMQFAKKRPLGPRGRFWLAAHLAATFGGPEIRKMTFEQRAAWTEAPEREISIRMAALTGTPMQGARDPWQNLAACIEWANMLSSADPEKYESALPVSLDAKSSGYQFFCLMTKSRDEASLVGLTTEQHAEPLYDAIAREAGLKRDEVKGPTMTRVYGSTERGRVENLMEDKGISAKEARALIRRIDEATKRRMPKALAMMSWLRKVATAHTPGGRADWLFKHLRASGAPLSKARCQELAAAAALVGSHRITARPPTPVESVGWLAGLGCGMGPTPEQWADQLERRERIVVAVGKCAGAASAVGNLTGFANAWLDGAMKRIEGEGTPKARAKRLHNWLKSRGFGSTFDQDRCNFIVAAAALAGACRELKPEERADWLCGLGLRLGITADQYRKQQARCEAIVAAVGGRTELAAVVGEMTGFTGERLEAVAKGLGRVGEVTWTAPSGARITHAPDKAEMVRVTFIPAGSVKPASRWVASDVNRRPNYKKLASAFAPNFVHSLDASLVVFAVQRLKELSLAVVHDSFATHACDVDVMRDALRDALADDLAGRVQLVMQEISERSGVPIPEGLVGDWDTDEIKRAPNPFD